MECFKGLLSPKKVPSDADNVFTACYMSCWKPNNWNGASHF